MSRPSWDEHGLGIAEVVSKRADCTRRKVGATLMLPDHSIVVSGYNGGPSKGPSCLEGECPRGRLSHDILPADSAYDTGGGTCVALHAEWNVLLRASWEQMLGSTLYVTEEPCHICRNLIAGTGIVRVVWPEGEWDVNVKDILKTKADPEEKPKQYKVSVDILDGKGSGYDTSPVSEKDLNWVIGSGYRYISMIGSLDYSVSYDVIDDESDICEDHDPVQHRDGKEPWCNTCGLNVNHQKPKDPFKEEK